MKLRHIEIRNFRSIRHVTLEPSSLTTLIGKNSCGKSNILRALKFFFTASARSASLDDVCKFPDDDGTWVECTFDNLTDSEREEWPDKYLRADGSVKIRRTMTVDGDRLKTTLHGYTQRPTAPWLQEDYAAYADMERWKELGIDVSEYAELGRRGGVTRDAFKNFRAEYVRRHADELEMVEELSETELKGRQSTAANLLPHFIFVPAVGDIVSVIYGKQTSLLNEIVAAVIEIGKSNPLYETAQVGLNAATELVNPSPQRLQTLTSIEQDLEQKLQSWPGTKVTIRAEIADLAKILVDGLVLAVDDGHDTHLADKGDGIQRQILFRVFQLYADFKAQRGIFAPTDGVPVADRRSSIVAFEEPELFLHPQAQEQFFDDLLTVSATDQVFLSTHSSFLVRLEHAEGIHIVRRPTPTSPTKITTADRGWLDVGDKKRLQEIELCSGEISKVFFADRVIVTEGPEDVIYLVGTAKQHANCLNRQVTVVHVSSKERIPALQKVLNAFGIPYVAACDRDPGNNSSEKTSQRIQNLVDAANDRHGNIATLEHFDPELPHVCRGAAPPDGNKPYNAMVFITTETPTDEFIEKVQSLYSMTN